MIINILVTKFYQKYYFIFQGTFKTFIFVKYLAKHISVAFYI